MLRLGKAVDGRNVQAPMRGGWKTGGRIQVTAVNAVTAVKLSGLASNEPGRFGG